MVKILSIDTSCDETASAVTRDTTILSNVVWSQASLHAKWGGVVPSLAKREHLERIDFVVNKALSEARYSFSDIDAVAVTVGPGLAIALEVGINKAKDIAIKYNKPLVAVNHIEGHVLSSLALPKTKISENTIKFPCLGVVTSGKHSELIYCEKIGKYKILASTVDDALGEALDKAARMLGFGYPGGSIIEKLAKEGDPNKYPLPTPLAGQENRMIFSYSGIKAALYRKVEEVSNKNKKTSKKDVCDLASSFQKSSFNHFLRVTEYVMNETKAKDINVVLAGGGVMANVILRKLLRNLFSKYNIPVMFPYSKKLYGDNAGMIGIAAYFKYSRGDVTKDLSKKRDIDRYPNLKIDQKPI